MESAREIDIRCRLNHPFLSNGEYKNGLIVENLNYIGAPMNVGIITLRDVINANILRPNIVNKIMFQMADALKALHDSNYLHLNISSESFVFTGKNDEDLGDLKLTNFGSARMTDLNYGIDVNGAIDIEYRPPEYISKEKTFYNKSVIWSLGAVYLELLTGIRFYGLDLGLLEERTTNEISTLVREETTSDKIRTHLELLPSSIKDHCINIIMKLLDHNPEKRPTIDKIINSIFFNGMISKRVIQLEMIYPDLSPLDYQYVISGVEQIKNILRSKFKLERIILYFFVIDLWYRIISLYPDIKTKDKNVIILSCLSIGLDLFSLVNRFALGTNYEEIAIERTVPIIYQILSGKIYRRYLFDACVSLNQLRKYEPLLTKADKYLSLDLNDLGYDRPDTISKQSFIMSLKV